MVAIAVAPTRKKGLLPTPAGVLLLAVCLLALPGANAQVYYSEYLLFDPVPLDVTSAADGQPITIELTEAPRGTAVTIHEWLTANNAGITNQNQQSLNDPISFQEALNEIVQEEGPFSAQLPQILSNHGTRLQESGDLDSALGNFEEALHITRVNQGLFSQEQTPIIKKIIENRLLLGDLGEADNQQLALLYLQQKIHDVGSPEMLSALEDFAQWNLFAFSALGASRSTVNTPDFFLVPDARQEDIHQFRIKRLVYANNIYWSIIQLMKADPAYPENRILDMEKRLAISNYHYARTVPPKPISYVTAPNLDAREMARFELTPVISSAINAPPLGGMGYRNGREALKRRQDFLVGKDNVDVNTLISTQIDLADWMLFFQDSSDRNRAMESYEQSYAQFREQLDDSALQSWFYPLLPVRLPTFINPEFSRQAKGIPEDQPLIYQGYVDVSLELNRYGNALRADVINSSPGTEGDVLYYLQQSLDNAQFRPRFSNGKAILNDKILIRYYYAY